MDWGNILYIVAVIVYFIYSASQSKKKKEAQRKKRQMDVPPAEAPEKGVTFEDLLKEIRDAQNPEKASEDQEFGEKELIEVESERPIRDLSAPKPERFDPYKLPKSEYDSVSPVEKVEIAEDAYDRMRAEEKRIKELSASIPSQKEVAYARKKKKVNPYAKRLKNKKTVREAIVLNEILRKRHF